MVFFTVFHFVFSLPQWGGCMKPFFSVFVFRSLAFACFSFLGLVRIVLVNLFCVVSILPSPDLRFDWQPFKNVIFDENYGSPLLDHLFPAHISCTPLCRHHAVPPLSLLTGLTLNRRRQAFVQEPDIFVYGVAVTVCACVRPAEAHSLLRACSLRCTELRLFA